jgi:MFS family permease
MDEHRLQSWKIFSAKSLRGFGIGLIVVSFPTYLSFIGIGPVEIGAIFSLVMIGTTFLLFLISYRVKRLGRRLSLLSFTIVVTVAAAGVAFSNSFLLMIPFSFFANFSLGGSDISVFLPLEQSLLALREQRINEAMLELSQHGVV